MDFIYKGDSTWFLVSQKAINFKLYNSTPRCLGLLCFTSPSLEEIGSSLFTFDSLAAHYLFLSRDSRPALHRFAQLGRDWINLVYI